MARGVKVDDATREKIIAVHNAGESLGAIAKMFSIARSTVSGIIKKYEKEKPDEFDKIRTEKKIEYIEDTKHVLRDLLSVMARRVKTIVEHEDRLEDVIQIICDSELDQKGKSRLVTKMSSIMCPKLTEFTIAFGTMYDKFEKMLLDDPEENGGGVVEVSSTIKIEPPTDDAEES